MKSRISNICDNFYKLAQNVNKSEKSVILDPNKKNEGFWAKFLFKSIASYAGIFPSINRAKDIAEEIAAYKKAPAYTSDKMLKELEQIKTALLESNKNLLNAKVNPILVLKGKGMQNVNPNIVNILSSNIDAVISGDMTKYQHYYLLVPNEPKDVVELDQTNGY